MQTVSPDHPEAGGYEAERDAVISPFEDPVEPPFRWTTLEKVNATTAGHKFCWWCGETKVFAGLVRIVKRHGPKSDQAGVGVMLRACGKHTSNVPALIDAADDEGETNRLIYG